MLSPQPLVLLAAPLRQLPVLLTAPLHRLLVLLAAPLPQLPRVLLPQSSVHHRPAPHEHPDYRKFTSSKGVFSLRPSSLPVYCSSAGWSCGMQARAI